MENNEKNLNEIEVSTENCEQEVAEVVEEIVQPIKEPKVQKERMRSAYRLKYGSFATAITAIFIAAVILINVVVNVLNERYPMTLDLTAENAYSVNPENAEFLREIDYEVELTVLFTEEMYLTYIPSYHAITDNSGGKYYKQTVDLLKQYHKYNKNISVEFIDPFGEAVSTIISEYTEADLTMNYGDILVKCYPNGKDEPAKLGVIPLTDCYDLQTDSSSTSYYTTGYESYTLEGNKIEQAVANGIFKTVNLSNVNVAVITANSSEQYTSLLLETAKQNAITLENCPVIEGYDFSKYDTMIICAPGKDYTNSEIKTISEWLENDGKQGKTLIYFGSTASPNLPNMYAFLEEWGIGVQRGYKYYSKDENYYSTDRTNLYLETLGTDYTAAVDQNNYSYISNNMMPLTTVYVDEANGTRSVEAILATADMSTYKKPDNDANFVAEGAGAQQPVALVSKNEKDGTSSYVTAFSSVDFITNAHITTKSENGNLKLLVNLINATNRNDQDQYVMETKVLSDATGAFTGTTTEAQTVLMAIIFIGLIPAAFVALAVLVYLRRKNY